jgi:hypothetical protein
VYAPTLFESAVSGRMAASCARVLTMSSRARYEMRRRMLIMRVKISDIMRVVYISCGLSITMEVI